MTRFRFSGIFRILRDQKWCSLWFRKGHTDRNKLQRNQHPSISIFFGIYCCIFHFAPDSNVHSQIYPLASPFPGILTLNMVLIHHSQLRSIGMKVEGGNRKKKVPNCCKKSSRVREQKSHPYFITNIERDCGIHPAGSPIRSRCERASASAVRVVEYSVFLAGEWWGRKGQHSNKLPATRFFFEGNPHPQ